MNIGVLDASDLESYHPDLASDLVAAGRELLGEGYDRRRRRNGAARRLRRQAFLTVP